MFIKKLRRLAVLKRIFLERLSEPLHLNILSVPVLLFGSIRHKVLFDLVLRPHNAWGILTAAERAKSQGSSSVTVLEFGVANGAGLTNMAKIGDRVTKATGIDVKVVGFDSGSGMPAPVDYRDHPDLYGAGDFPMDFAALTAVLPSNAAVVLGPVEETVPRFLDQLDQTSPIGYVVLDLDYYSSTKQCLDAFATSDPQKFLPTTAVYLDDVYADEHNSRCGELLAVSEFNDQPHLRYIERMQFLKSQRVFHRALWLGQIYSLHVLDHPARQDVSTREAPQVIVNPYVK